MRSLAIIALLALTACKEEAAAPPPPRQPDTRGA